MATTDSLNRCVKNAIEDERQRVKKMRRDHPDVKHRITDYAAATIACGYKRSGSTFKGYSASPVGHKYTEKIKRRLETLAPIGDKRPGCKNTVGACSEPHAADKVMKTFPGCKMDELQFSDAYRPRTAKRLRYCQNCKDTFTEVL